MKVTLVTPSLFVLFSLAWMGLSPGFSLRACPYGDDVS